MKDLSHQMSGSYVFKLRNISSSRMASEKYSFVKLLNATFIQLLTKTSGFVCFQAVMNRVHTVSVPYAVMKACPLSWVQRVHVHKGNTRLPARAT